MKAFVPGVQLYVTWNFGFPILGSLPQSPILLLVSGLSALRPPLKFVQKMIKSFQIKRDGSSQSLSERMSTKVGQGFSPHWGRHRLDIGVHGCPWGEGGHCLLSEE